MYVLIPFGGHGRAETAVVIPAGMLLFRPFGLHWIWGIDTSTGLYGTGTENHGKLDIFTGTVWTETGSQYFFGK